MQGILNSVCVITARDGSKRIPRKNIKDFHGKPIIAYSIDLALRSNLFDEVMVSTDDQEIADIAISHGAKVPFMRSAKNSDDYSSTLDVLYEVLDEYKKIGLAYDYLCCIYPTAPLLQLDTLVKGYGLLVNQKFNCVYPVCSYDAPVQIALKIKDGKSSLFYPEYSHKRSQDLEPAYYDAGQFYWFDVSLINDNDQIYTDNSGVIVVDKKFVQDIDDQEDWSLAELKYNLLHENR